MAKPVHLDTTVKGSAGMLQEGAAALRKAAQTVGRADNANHSARNTAYGADWEGQSNEAFLAEFVPSLTTIKDLKQTCTKFATAFDDLAGTVKSVREQMEKIITTARAGALKVEGPIVMRPEKPTGRPVPSDYEGDSKGYAEDAADYKDDVAAYNRKVKVFNKCLAMYTAARKDEEKGHTEFWDAVNAEKGLLPDAQNAWNIGNQTVGNALGAIASVDGEEKKLLGQIDDRQRASTTYQKIAAGISLDKGFSQAELKQLKTDAARATIDGWRYEKQLGDLQKVSKHLPEWTKDAATAYPGKKIASLDSVDSNSPVAKRLTKTVLSNAKYGGVGFSAVGEAMQVASGEQSWGKAVFDTGVSTAAGAGGGALGATLCAPFLPPAGSILCGTGGSILAGIGGAEVADAMVPPETPYPEKAAPIKDVRGAEGGK